MSDCLFFEIFYWQYLFLNLQFINILSMLANICKNKAYFLYQLEPFVKNKPEKKSTIFRFALLSTLLLTLLLPENMGCSACSKYRMFWGKHTIWTLYYIFLPSIILFWINILFQGHINVFTVKHLYLTITYNYCALLQHRHVRADNSICQNKPKSL